MRNASIIIALLIMIIIQGCGTEKESSKGKASPQNAELQTGQRATDPAPTGGWPIIEDKGMIVFLPFEGGFYGILTSDSTKYDPTNLGPGFRKPGLLVSFTASPSKQQNSIHMWGTIIDIIKIDSLPKK